VKNLLELALEAHGGLTRRSHLKAVTADLSVTGALWQIRVAYHLARNRVD